MPCTRTEHLCDKCGVRLTYTSRLGWHHASLPRQIGSGRRAGGGCSQPRHRVATCEVSA